MGRADVYLQPEAKDPVLSDETVLAIAAGHTDRAGRPVEIDESGGEARVYLLSGDVVVKTQRPHRLRPRTSLAKEARLLEFLAAHLGGRVPHVYGYGHSTAPEGPVEYLVISRMPGRAARHTAFGGGSRAQLLRETGRLLARLHAVPAHELADSAGLFPTDQDGHALRARLEPGFADLLDVLTEREIRWPVTTPPGQAVEHALQLIPARFAPVVVHSNPGPTHVFCDDAGVLTGLIDFGDCYLSHPAMDLHRWPDPVDRLVLREGYSEGRHPDAGFDATWAAAMIYADIAALAGSAVVAKAAAVDLAVRLAS